MHRTNNFTNTFVKDKAEGEKYEALAANYVEYDTIEYSTGNAPMYDFITTKNDKSTKYEVKYDRACAYSGNVAIEVSNCGRPSGMYNTNADFYIIFAQIQQSYNVYIIPLGKLQSIARSHRIIKGGYKYQSKFHIVPISILEEYLTRPL